MYLESEEERERKKTRVSSVRTLKCFTRLVVTSLVAIARLAQQPAHSRWFLMCNNVGDRELLPFQSHRHDSPTQCTLKHTSSNLVPMSRSGIGRPVHLQIFPTHHVILENMLLGERACDSK